MAAADKDADARCRNSREQFSFESKNARQPGLLSKDGTNARAQLFGARARFTSYH